MFDKKNIYYCSEKSEGFGFTNALHLIFFQISTYLQRL